MDEARAVLERLQRIEALDRDGAAADTLLGEVRELLREAETWLALDDGDSSGAESALARCRAAVEAGVTPVA
jgi:hypothetical protein